MTVATQVASQLFTGNGSATNFPWSNMKVLSADHIRVSRILISTEAVSVVSSADYTVNGVGSDSGSIDYQYLGSPLSSLYQLLVERIVPYTQEVDIDNEGGFLPEVVEEQLDLMVMQIQQLRQAVSDLIDGGVAVSLTGMISGPASSTDNNFALFAGTSGVIIKDAGYGASAFAAAAHTHAFSVLTSKPTTIAGYGITDLNAAVGTIIEDLFNAGTQSGITVVYDGGIPSLSLTVGGEVWQEVMKTATTTIASNTVLASDAELTFTMLANTTYEIEGEIHCSVSSTSGQKSGITGPASPTAIRAWEVESDNNSTTTISYASSYTGLRTNTPGGNREVRKRIKMTIENGANAGTFAYQFAQNVSSATVLTVRKGSWFRYRTV